MSEQIQTIEIDTGNHVSSVYIGEDFKNVQKYLPKDKKIVIITDSNILHHYGSNLPDYPIIEIGLGEKNKTLDTLDFIFEKFVALELDRSSFVLAIGGGIVCDVAGFAASSYMRGLSFGFISTTLLSQVDASVGGKNGVNFRGYKNMLGVFNQPDFVICDPNMLKTLPEKEFRAGFAEIIKAAAIKDYQLFETLEKNSEQLLNFDSNLLSEVIYQSVQIKADVVKADEREKGERRKLNFGHTLAHSFEKLTGMLHGEAVSIGMNYAGIISNRLELLENSKLQQLQKLIKQYKLPVKTDLSFNDVFNEMKKDKKREGDKIHFILLKTLGDAIVQPIELKRLEEIVNDLR